MNNLVSIITPSYNSSKFIEECINSVITQSYIDWEMIIVDDYSTDNSRDLILKFAKEDNRIKTIFLDENVGAAAARNIAIKQSKGKYIAFLDSDDIWKSEKIEKQLSFMNDRNIAFSFTSYQPMSEDGKEYFNIIKVPEKMTYASYLRNTIIGCLTVIIDKEKTGKFQMPNIRSSHDMALWLLIMKRGFSAYGLDENLAYYRIVSNSNTSKKWKAAKEVWDVYRKVNKTGEHRKALFKNMLNSLIKYEQIVTTLPKAKELKPQIDKVITIGKKNILSNKKRLFSKLQDKKSVSKVFDVFSERYNKRKGGYSRVLKAGFRTGDDAPMAVIELVDRNIEAKRVDKPKKIENKETEKKEVAPKVIAK